MKIVVLDGYGLNPGDLSWNGLEALGELTVYDRTAPVYIVFRSSTAEDPSVEGVQGSLGALNGYSDSRYVGNVLTIDNVRLIYE